ncbi:MAG: TVP38/TMEM64 family protein [Pseudanabaena sp.]|nr:MAG: TVP38/TMEM64 family protein [Pseudanabaena sp.]
MARSQLAKYRPWLKVALNAIALALFVSACYQLNINGLLQNILLWIKDLGLFGVLAFIVIYNLATVLFIPGSLLTLGGGALYGMVWGVVYVFIASTLGATLAFLIGRYFARDWVSKKFRNNLVFRAIDAAIAKEGFKIVFLARLSPIFPFNMLNYVFGITRVALKDYILGSIGMIPATIMYVYLGSLAVDISMISTQSLTESNAIPWTIRIVGLIATVLMSVYIGYLARRTLRQITRE